MLNLDGMIKTVAGEILSVFLRTIGYTVFSIALNLILLVSQWEKVVNVLSPSLSTTEKFQSLAIIIGVVGFPVLFFILGKKQAIQNSLAKLLKAKKYDIVCFLVERIYAKNPNLFDLSGKVPTSAGYVTKQLTEIFRDLPSAVVRVLRYFVEKTGFYELFAQSVEEYQKRSTESIDGTPVDSVSEILSNMIPGDVIKSDIKYPLIALVANICLFFL
jgi:hypothetical protein